MTDNALELHFGLGAIEATESVTVEWQDSETSTHTAELYGWVTLSRQAWTYCVVAVLYQQANENNC